MSLEFELERFERVTAAPGSVLLRVAGRWYAAEPLRLDAPVLLVERRDGSRRLTALPGPDDRAPLATEQGQTWRAAFSATEEVLAREPSFGLDLGSEGVIDLPAPTERRRAGAEAVTEPRGGKAHEREPRGAQTPTETTETQARARAAAEREVQNATRSADKLARERDGAVAAATAAERAALQASGQVERLADALRSARAEAQEARESAAQALEQLADARRKPDRGDDEGRLRRDLERRLREAEAQVELARQGTVAEDEHDDIELRTAGVPPSRRLPAETAVGLAVVIGAVIAAALLILGLLQVVLSS